VVGHREEGQCPLEPGLHHGYSSTGRRSSVVERRIRGEHRVEELPVLGVDRGGIALQQILDLDAIRDLLDGQRHGIPLWSTDEPHDALHEAPPEVDREPDQQHPEVPRRPLLPGCLGLRLGIGDLVIFGARAVGTQRVGAVELLAPFVTTAYAR
jgi:hypothetical protein